MTRYAICAALLFATIGEIQATTEVNASGRLLDVKTIAVMPAQCPASVDCLRIDQVFLEKLILMARFAFEETPMLTSAMDDLSHSSSSGDLSVNSGAGIQLVIPSDKVRRVAFENSLSLEVPSDRARALTLLHADSFLALRVGEATSEEQGTVGVGNASGTAHPVGTSTFANVFAVASSFAVFTNRGSLEIVMMDAQGNKLLQGNAFGETGWQTKIGLLGSLIADTLNDGFDEGKRAKERDRLATEAAEARARVPQLDSFVRPGMKITDVLKLVGQPSSMDLEVTPDRKLKQIAKYVADDHTEFVVVFISGVVVSVTKSR